MYGQPGYGQSMQPVYGQPMQPMYGQPVPPMYNQPMMQQPVQQGPMIIKIDNNDSNNGTPCQFCGTNTPQIVRKKIGCVAIAWGCCLLYFTGILCCIPCCIDDCKDSQLVCTKCQQVKNTIQANCC